MGDSICKDTFFTIHAIAVTLLAGSIAYIYLNETNKLDKVKRQCMDKAMDIKEDLKEKLD